MNVKGKRHLEVRLARGTDAGPQVPSVEVNAEIIDQVFDRGLELFIIVKAVNLVSKVAASWLVRR